MIVTTDRDRHARRMLDALMAGNSLRADRVAAEALEGGLDFVELLDHVIAPALRVVGERWQDGRVRHTQERIATTAAESLLARLAPPPARDDAPVWILATADGDDHRVGVRMAAAALSVAGVRGITFVGRAMDEVAAAATEADALCMSCSGPWSAIAARSVALEVAGTGTPVLLGGRGWNGWHDPPAITHVASMSDLVARANEQYALPGVV